MIARELLDRGIVRRLCVLCPAHLCDQWERELRQKFAIEAAVVRPSSVARLERELPRQDLSIYEHYPHLIASIDFVKAERHRGPFLRTAPDLVIVDEAHGAARPRGDRERGQHQRHELVHALAADRERHLLLVTATPHSGIEESFRSLLGLLDPGFEQPPPGSVAAERQRLLPHVIQRRRKDVERWLGAETPFPERVAEETRYELGRDYLALYRDVLEYCRETVEAGAGLCARRSSACATGPRSRCCAASSRARARRRRSSPPAPSGSRAEGDESSEEEKDSAYRPQVTDVSGRRGGGRLHAHRPVRGRRSRLDRRRAPAPRRVHAARPGARGPRRRPQARGARPHPRFAAPGRLPAGGVLPVHRHRRLPRRRGSPSSSAGRSTASRCARSPARSATRSGASGSRSWSATTGASWSRPTACPRASTSRSTSTRSSTTTCPGTRTAWSSARAGSTASASRAREVKTVLLYGTNNEVDQVVLDVLLRKARTIRNALGVSVPVPVEAERVVEAVVGSVLLRRPGPGRQMELAFTTPEVSRLHDAWDRAAAREKEERAFFSQSGIQPDEVERELEATDSVLGEPEAVLRFLADAVQRLGGELRPTGKPGVHHADPGRARGQAQGSDRPRLPAPDHPRRPARSRGRAGRPHASRWSPRWPTRC